jgi:transcriptional regulator with XRE-family HTH domain
MTGATRARVRTPRLPASSRGYGHRLRLARLTLGVTEGEVAAALGITLRTYRRWEARVWPHVQAGPILAFAQMYGVSVDWLVTGDPGGLGSHLSKRTAGKVVLFCPRGKAWSGPFSPQALQTLAAVDATSAGCVKAPLPSSRRRDHGVKHIDILSILLFYGRWQRDIMER